MTKTELKKTVVKIKKLLKKRDYDVIDTGIELARGLDEPAVFETLLEGCSLDEEGKLVRNKIFSGTGPAQPFLDYALLNLIAYAPENTELDESLKFLNIKLLSFSDLAWTELPSCIACLTNLTNLVLRSSVTKTCSSLQNVDVLANLTKLTSLDLRSCSSLQNADGLSNLTNLTSLNLLGCESLQNVDGLSNLTNLTSLNLGSCDSLQNADGLSNLTNLTSLNLTWCKSLQNVDGLANLTKLPNLDLARCISLQNVDGLANLPNLTNLDLFRCDKVQPKPYPPWMQGREEVAAYQEEIKKSMK